MTQTEDYFRERARRADRTETPRILDRAGKGKPPVRAMNFSPDGRRVSANADKRKPAPSGNGEQDGKVVWLITFFNSSALSTGGWH